MTTTTIDYGDDHDNDDNDNNDDENDNDTSGSQLQPGGKTGAHPALVSAEGGVATACVCCDTNRLKLKHKPFFRSRSLRFALLVLITGTP